MDRAEGGVEDKKKNKGKSGKDNSQVNAGELKEHF